MEKYFGIPCPICNKEFAEHDDIVVCPDCGAPHHRACYKAHGRCAFDEQHVQGNAWKNPNLSLPQGQAAAAGDTAHCPRCNAANPAANTFCHACGARMNATGAGEAASPATTPDYRKNYKQNTMFHNPSVRIDDTLGGLPVKEVAQFVGENALYYLPRFKLLELQKNVPSINISAMVFTFFYYFNRKMYKIGAAMLALFLLSMLPNLLMIYYSFPSTMNGILSQGVLEVNYSLYPNLVIAANVLHYVFLLASIASGFLANKLYFGFVLGNVRKLKEKFQGRSETEYAQALAINGRTNKVLVIAVMTIFFVAYLLFCVILMSTYPFQ